MGEICALKIHAHVHSLVSLSVVRCAPRRTDVDTSMGEICALKIHVHVRSLVSLLCVVLRDALM